MWTPATRRQHSRDELRYETDLTDAEWALLEPIMPEPNQRGRPREWPFREIMNPSTCCGAGWLGDCSPTICRPGPGHGGYRWAWADPRTATRRRSGPGWRAVRAAPVAALVPSSPRPSR